MVSPLLGSLAATINSAMSSLFIDATLTRQVVPSSPSYDPADPPAPVPVNYSCKAVRDRYSVSDKRNPNIIQGDVKILVLVNSLSVEPQKDDLITIQGASFSVVDFDVDPANALWTIQGRK
jgi:hypothetical protein